MATIVIASPTPPSSAAVAEPGPITSRPSIQTPASVQDAVRNLPSPPTKDPSTTIDRSSNAQSAICNQGVTSKSLTPPATPGAASPSGPGLLQAVAVGVSKNLLTPQTTGTTNSHRLALPAAGVSSTTTRQAIQTRTPTLLKEAVLYQWMDVDAQIETQWQSTVREPLDQLVSGVVRHRLSYMQDTMYAARVRRWPHKDEEKRPSLVISVADARDRKAVKKELKRHQWLKDKVKRCGLQLMVVEDLTKLESNGRAKTTPATATHLATLILGNHSDVDASDTYCGRTLESSSASSTTPSSFTLGGTIIINDALYGLTAGHAFFNLNLEQEDEASGESVLARSESSESTDEWLEDPSNPFVFKEDDESSQDASTTDGTSTLSSAQICSRRAQQLQADRETTKAPSHAPSWKVSMLTPSIPATDSRGKGSSVRNCDWGIVELPKGRSVPPNNYVESGLLVPILGAVSDAARPSGAVKVILRNSQVLQGHLRANAASYRVGTCLFDVRLIYLDESLPTACSGAWVVYNDSVCGYIIAARSDPRSVYMVPIHSILQDIRETLGVQDVFIPVQDEFEVTAQTNLGLGQLSDLVPKEKHDLVGQGGQFHDLTSTTSSREQPILPSRSSSRGVGSAPGQEIIPSMPKVPKPTHRRPPLPGKKESEISVTSREVPRREMFARAPVEMPADASTAIAHSSTKIKNEKRAMDRDFTDQAFDAVAMAAYVICLPCTWPLKVRKRRHQRVHDMENISEWPRTADREKYSCIAAPASSPAPMLYRPEMLQTVSAGTGDVSNVYRSAQVEDHTFWPGYAVPGLPSPSAVIASPVSSMSNLSDSVSISDVHVQSPPENEGENPSLSAVQIDDDRDNISIILSSENEEDNVNNDWSKQLFSRNETDFGLPTAPGISVGNAFQNWAHSPSFTPTVGYAHTTVST